MKNKILDNNIEVFIKTSHNNKSHVVSISPYASITSIKHQIEDIISIPWNKQIIYYSGKSILDHQSLSEYDIKPHSLIFVHDSLDGGEKKIKTGTMLYSCFLFIITIFISYFTVIRLINYLGEKYNERKKKSSTGAGTGTGSGNGSSKNDKYANENITYNNYAFFNCSQPVPSVSLEDNSLLSLFAQGSFLFMILTLSFIFFTLFSEVGGLELFILSLFMLFLLITKGSFFFYIILASFFYYLYHIDFNYCNIENKKMRIQITVALLIPVLIYFINSYTKSSHSILNTAICFIIYSIFLMVYANLYLKFDHGVYWIPIVITAWFLIIKKFLGKYILEFLATAFGESKTDKSNVMVYYIFIILVIPLFLIYPAMNLYIYHYDNSVKKSC